MRLKGILFGFLLLPGLVLADQKQLYLLGNFTYKGTPVTHAILFRDDRVESLEECQDFVRNQVRGTSRGKNLFRHYIRELPKGISIHPNYTCFETTMAVSRWSPRDFYKHIYLIDLRNGVSFTPFPDTNSCWASIRKERKKHSTQLFCARMNQRLGDR